ncbi:MAG: type 1 glutamine amidotransferase [Novosphingobium sp.]|nr:type 1 glutamine amidotransferase [Novosphingobium sp.]
MGILEAGGPPESLADFGSYPDMIRRHLGESRYEYVEYDVPGGQLPLQADACPAYVVTGSPAGVYDPLPWIAELKAFLVAAGGQARLLGICFGHQVMAEAFGGKVEKSPKGWGLGALAYSVDRPQPWMEAVGSFRLPASHQDQVVAVPPGAEVIAGSDFARFGMLAYRDQGAASLQLHPEFTPEFAAALIERRRAAGIDDEQAGRALASLRLANDSARVAGWLRAFLEGRSLR